MDWLIFSVVVIWLALLSWFDLRKGEIPHSAWVIVPLVCAGAYRAQQGGWALVVLAGMVTLVSERKRVAQWIHLKITGRVIPWIPVILLGVVWSAQKEPLPALSILGFWIAWECGWWGGADASAAITLILVWPGNDFYIAFFGFHVVAALGFMIFTYQQERKLVLHSLPGLPIMFLTAFFYGMNRVIAETL
jgi:hypothetical protein